MPPWAGFLLFVALFFGAGILIVIAAGRQRRRWRSRPDVLRALAARRGYRFDEKPDKPSNLTPIRPLDKTENLVAMELPAAVRGRSLDCDFMLFDVFTEKKTGSGSSTRYNRHYETFITIKSDGQWPHFELAALTHSKPGSLTGTLLALAGDLGEIMMKQRGLVHVPIPDHPGFQLYAANAADGQAIRDAFVPLFEKRGAWWVGGLDDTLTLQRQNSNSPVAGSLVGEKDLDRFVDEALEIERAARAAIRP